MIYQKLLDRCPDAVPTEGMAYEAWLEKRMTCIGGSDAGPVMGLSDYGSALTVYLVKKGLVRSGEMSRAAKRGKILESVIRQLTQEEHPNLIIESVPYMFYSPEHSFMGANLDSVILAETPVVIGGAKIKGLGGHEIKSSKTGYGFGDGEVPDTYYAQVQHYMAVLDLPWFLLSVYVLDTEEVRHYPIFRNEEFIKTLIDKETDFWRNYFVPDIMPAAIGLENEEDMITGMFGGGTAPLTLGREETAMCEEYVELNTRLKEMEDRKKAISTNLKEVIVQQALPAAEKKVSAIAGRYSVSWSRFETVRVDTDALKKPVSTKSLRKRPRVGVLPLRKRRGHKGHGQKT
jgi:putative phage-type endonuclease